MGALAGRKRCAAVRGRGDDVDAAVETFTNLHLQRKSRALGLVAGPAFTAAGPEKAAEDETEASEEHARPRREAVAAVDALVGGAPHEGPRSVARPVRVQARAEAAPQGRKGAGAGGKGAV